jgi:hypothetical protein
MNTTLNKVLIGHQHRFHPIVRFDGANDKLLPMDFTSDNTELSADIIENTEKFSEYISNKLNITGSRFGIGGYAEHRTVYSRSGVFDADERSEEPRRLTPGLSTSGVRQERLYMRHSKERFTALRSIIIMAIMELH